MEIQNIDSTSQQASPLDKGSVSPTLNNWTQPPPLEFHLIHSPDLNYRLAEMCNKQTKQTDTFPSSKHLKSKLKNRSKDRDKYTKLKQELKFLEKFLHELKELRASDLLMYKQTLLTHYLSGFVSQITMECQEKGDYLRSIWNILIQIFQQLFDRVVKDNFNTETRLLEDEIKTHNSYQEHMERITKENRAIRERELKYQDAVRNLMATVATVNQELKVQRQFSSKSNLLAEQINKKYTEIRSDYIDLLVTGSTGEMTYEEAQELIKVKEDEFSNRISQKPKQVKMTRERRAKIIDSNTVAMLIQDLNEDEYSFEVEQESAPVRKLNQKMQTDPIPTVTKINASLQTDYFYRMRLGLVADAEVETDKEPVAKSRRPFSSDLQEEKGMAISRQYQFIIYPENKKKAKGGKKRRESSFLNMFDASSINRLSAQVLVEARQGSQSSSDSRGGSRQDLNSITPKTMQARSSLQQDMLARKSSTANEGMRRVGRMRPYGRQSNFVQDRRLRTEAGDQITFNVRKSKSSKNGRKSELLMLDGIKKSITHSMSTLEHLRDSAHKNPTVRIRNDLVVHYEPGVNVSQLIKTRSPHFNVCQNKTIFFQNTQISSLNQQIRSKIGTLISSQSSKGAVIPQQKCLKWLSQIYKLAMRYLKEGCQGINLYAVTLEYFSAMEGQKVSAELRSKKQTDFIKHLSLLAKEHFIVRNYFLLCGLEPIGLHRSSSKNLVKVSNSRSSFRDLKSGDLSKKAEDAANKGKSALVYTSQVVAYFSLLQALNCAENHDQVQNYFTTIDHIKLILPVLGDYYGDGQFLSQEILSLIQNRVSQDTSEASKKLDIFKCLQITIQTVLEYKERRLKSYQVLKENLSLSEIKDLANTIVSISANEGSQIIGYLQILKNCYSSQLTLVDLCTFATVQGLEIDLGVFSQIQESHRHQIVKACKQVNPQNTSELACLARNVGVKVATKKEFMTFLRVLWVHNSERVCDQLMGDDLCCLYSATLPDVIDSRTSKGLHRVVVDWFNKPIDHEI